MSADNDLTDDDIVDLLEVVTPGRDPDAQEKPEAAEQSGDRPFPDPTPVDHDVDPDEKLDMSSMADLDSLLETLGVSPAESKSPSPVDATISNEPSTLAKESSEATSTDADISDLPASEGPVGEVKEDRETTHSSPVPEAVPLDDDIDALLAAVREKGAALESARSTAQEAAEADAALDELDELFAEDSKTCSDETDFDAEVSASSSDALQTDQADVVESPVEDQVTPTQSYSGQAGEQAFDDILSEALKNEGTDKAVADSSAMAATSDKEVGSSAEHTALMQKDGNELPAQAEVLANGQEAPESALSKSEAKSEGISDERLAAFNILVDSVLAAAPESGPSPRGSSLQALSIEGQGTDLLVLFEAVEHAMGSLVSQVSGSVQAELHALQHALGALGNSLRNRGLGTLSQNEPVDNASLEKSLLVQQATLQAQQVQIDLLQQQLADLQSGFEAQAAKVVAKVIREELAELI